MTNEEAIAGVASAFGIISRSLFLAVADQPGIDRHKLRSDMVGLLAEAEEMASSSMAATILLSFGEMLARLGTNPDEEFPE